MGDGKVNKYAIVINARNDAKGVQQTAAAVQDLRNKGYVTFAAGDKNHPVWADMYVSSPKALKGMIAGIKAVTDDDDRVVVRVIQDTNDASGTASKSKFASKAVMAQLDVFRRRNGLFTEKNYLSCYRHYSGFSVALPKSVYRAGAYWCIKAAKEFRFDGNKTFNTCWDTLTEGYFSPEATKRCFNLISSGKFVFSDGPIKKVRVKKEKSRKEANILSLSETVRQSKRCSTVLDAYKGLIKFGAWTVIYETVRNYGSDKCKAEVASAVDVYRSRLPKADMLQCARGSDSVMCRRVKTGQY